MKQLLLGIIISIMASFTAMDINAQQTTEQPPQAQLPSEQTAQSLAQLPSEIERPDTRRAPDGELGNANKETWLPMGNLEPWILLSMIGLYACFLSVKQSKFVKKI